MLRKKNPLQQNFDSNTYTPPNRSQNKSTDPPPAPGHWPSHQQPFASFAPFASLSPFQVDFGCENRGVVFWGCFFHQKFEWDFTNPKQVAIELLDIQV